MPPGGKRARQVISAAFLFCLDALVHIAHQGEMLDADVVAVSPASVWRVLKQAGLLSRWKAKPSRKGSGFEQPLQPHQHWHIDVSYINVCGTFYYLCSVLDGYSRSIVHWDLRESMRETDIEVILERVKEK